MDDIELTLDQALELLDRAVELKGADYVYPRPALDSPGAGNGCFYLHADGPGCIVGHVLHWAGLTNEELSSIEGAKAGGVGRRVPRLHMDERVGDLLAHVQSEQDTGETWGAAVIEGRRFLNG